MKLNQKHGFSICSIIRLEIRWRYNHNHMSSKVLKQKKASLYEFTQNYSNNINNCIEFFKSMKWLDGFLCDHCGCHKYYLVKCVGKTKTLYVLESSLCHKQHSLLSGTIFQSCKLDLYKFLLGIFFFYESDVFNIGAKFKNKVGRTSEQQPILGILSTDKENNYPRFIKLRLITDYTGLSLKKNIEKCCVLSRDVLLNTDGEKGFNTLNEKI